jgi:hypothetical protein
MGQTFTDKLFLGSVATKPAISSVVGVPVAAGNAGDLALSDNGTLYVYDGSAWVATQDALPALADGEIYIGVSGLPPVATSITSGGGISATGSAGAIILGSTAGGDLSGSVDTATVVGLQGTAVSATAPALNEVLKYDGAQWAPAPDVAGSIGGTIAATEIAFGTALDTIGGSANLTWNSGTDTLAISDALILLTTTATPGVVQLDHTPTGNRLVFTIAAGQATIASAFSGGGAQPLNLSTSDLKLAGLSGSPGDVLTVDLLGAPEWQAPANTANNLGLFVLAGSTAPTATEAQDNPAFDVQAAGTFTLPTGAPLVDGRQITFIFSANTGSVTITGANSVTRTMSPRGGSTWVYSTTAVGWHCTSNV